ncbi:MAG: eL32 family ribosomal protein [Nanoarchaeota archaeon]
MKNKPKFLRQDGHKVKKLKKKWRRPKGMHNKMRLGLKGHRKSPSVGYGSKRENRGYINGLKPVLIRDIGDLSKLDKSCIAIISSKLGLKKRIIVANKLKQMNTNVINLDVNEFLKKNEKKGAREEK